MPTHTEHTFIFTPTPNDTRTPKTARKIHIRRLYDLFQLSVQRQDFARATRAWAILARCKEFDWMAMWMTGLLLLGGQSNLGGDGGGEGEVPREKLEFLRTMMLQNTGEKEVILQELLFCLIRRGEYREALSELELYLPAFPYQDNPVLHTHAALLCIYMAQPSLDSDPSYELDRILLRDAQTHLDHAKRLDPENVLTQAFLDKIQDLQRNRKFSSKQSSQTLIDEFEDDSEDDEAMPPNPPPTSIPSSPSSSSPAPTEDDDSEDELGTPKAKRTRIEE